MFKIALSLLLVVPFLLKGQTFVRSELPVELNRAWEMTMGPDDYLYVSAWEGAVYRINTENGSKKLIHQANDFFEGAPEEKWPYCSEPNIGTGTLGLTLHPDFLNPETSYIYYLYSYNHGGDVVPKTQFKIVRLKWNAVTEKVVEEKDLVLELPTGYDHLGGRLLAVNENGKNYLYLTIGDNGTSEDSSPDCFPDQSLNPNNFTQDPSTKNGKIHRFNIDGTIPYDNPIYGNSFYTRGHRNPQGLMFNTQLQKMFSVEHGDQTDDEINRLEKGMNYGWKQVRGYHFDNNHPGESEYINNYVPNLEIKNDSLVQAFYSWCSSPITGSDSWLDWCTVAPSDGIYYCSASIPQWNNSFLVVTLKDGESTNREVYQFKLDSYGNLIPSTVEKPNPRRFFGEDQSENGRLRDIAISNDGKKIYLLRDGGEGRVIVYTVEDESVNLPMISNNNCAGIYPNPSSESIRLDQLNKFKEVTQIYISGIDGTLINYETSNYCALDITSLLSGTYILSIVHSEGVCTSKFVKIKE